METSSLTKPSLLSRMNLSQTDLNRNRKNSDNHSELSSNSYMTVTENEKKRKEEVGKMEAKTIPERIPKATVSIKDRVDPPSIEIINPNLLTEQEEMATEMKTSNPSRNSLLDRLDNPRTKVRKLAERLTSPIYNPNTTTPGTSVTSEHYENSRRDPDGPSRYLLTSPRITRKRMQKLSARLGNHRFQIHSGSKLSGDYQSTSTSSFHHKMHSSPMTRLSRPLVKQPKFTSSEVNQLPTKRFGIQGNGPLPGKRRRLLISTSCHGENKNSTSTEGTCSDTSTWCPINNSTGSSSMIKQSELGSQKITHYSSQTHHGMMTSDSCTSLPRPSRISPPNPQTYQVDLDRDPVRLTGLDREGYEKQKCVEIGMRTSAVSPILDASTFIGAHSVTQKAMPPTKKKSVQDSMQQRSDPKYLRNWIWNLDGEEDGDRKNKISTSIVSETATPWIRVPSYIKKNPEIENTIMQNQHLFKIVTPIKVPVLQNLLRAHPNQEFVESVCHSFSEGSWPWADIPEHYPLTHEEQNRPFRDSKAIKFVKEYLEEEIAEGRYSQTFGSNLLPGMYSAPIGVVPKPHSEKLRLIDDHSAGRYSLNSMIPRDARHIILDDMQRFGSYILRMKRRYPDESLVVFKSDVAHAFRNVPMAPEWQMLQTIQIEGLRYVNRNLAFGTAAAPRLWTEAYSLVLYIAEKRGLTGLSCWMDDTFSVERASELSFYEPYQRIMPTKQTRFLKLLDEIGIPHESNKQVFGEVLTVIGFEIDPNNLKISLPEEARKKLEEEIMKFCSTRRQTVANFRRLAGYLNWVINVFPYLKPALRVLYDKIRGKQSQHTLVYLNQRVRRSLSWFMTRSRELPGVLMLNSLSWSIWEADIIIYCDASLHGIGFLGTKQTHRFPRRCSYLS